ncbi:Sec23-binding domain of Sec16-domain-containing protein [Scleroderma citrinum]
MDPYAPAKTVVGHATSQFRGRSSSNGSVFFSGPTSQDTLQHHNEFGLGHGSYPGEPGPYGNAPVYPFGQELHISAPRPPYAPSPSLLGSNDPLGRVSARAPIVSFGFGGKLLTCFHGSADLSTGFDVALSTRRITNVTIRELHKVLPDYALEPRAALYPGPLFSDPGTPVTSLVRSGASSNSKAKKLCVIKYLDERAEEILRGTTYISGDSERQRAEDKLALVRLLKVMVENDGVLHGSPQIDAAVRVALVPHISNDLGDPGKDMSSSLTTPALASSMAGAYNTSTLSNGNETPVSVTATLPSSLDKIQELLVRGERRQAYHYALDEKLWPHAMIIASSIDKEAWKEVVSEFLKVELGVHGAVQHGATSRSEDHPQCQTNGREWLRVVYSLFSGQGPAAIQELVPMNLLSRAIGMQVPGPALPNITPLSANFPPAMAAQVPSESLSKWSDIVASVLTNTSNPEWSNALTSLGDCLLSHRHVEAAHICYILSPQTSIVGGVGSPSARIILLGSQSSHSRFIFARDSDSIVLSEILEFAFSLKATPKGQEPFLGFPHLQTYKLIRAAYLAELGHVQAASRYCEAITASMGRPSPYFNAVMVDQLKTLADHLIGAPHADKSGSWISGKVNKPSLDSIGSWLEGRLTKFIAGEGDESSPTANGQQPAFSGPFSAYSSLSSAGTSANPSPPPTTMGYQFTSSNQPRRTGSAVSLPSMQSHPPIDRASSAMEYHRPTRNASPAPPKTAPLQASYPFSPYAPHANGHAGAHGYVSAYSSNASSRKSSLEITPEEAASISSPVQEHQPQESGGWWNALNSADSAPTPTATTFLKVEDVHSSEDGLISLMDDQTFAVTPSPSATPRRLETAFEDEEDDLGLGNNSSKKKSQVNEEPTGGHSPSQTHQQEAATSEEKSGTQPATQASASSGSWFSRFWRRPDTPGPVKANLGEETSFYYDKELKRWVNKKDGVQAVQPSVPPPPPARAQTASPGQARRPMGGPGGISGPPLAPQLARTSSAIDLTTPMSAKPLMRPRSNLVPSEAASRATPSAPGVSTPAGFPPPPPMGRPRSQAAKKNVRRYVDVFQQEGNTSTA